MCSMISLQSLTTTGAEMQRSFSTMTFFSSSVPFLLSLLLTGIRAEGHFVVVAPRVLRPNADFLAAVTVFDGSLSTNAPQDVTLSIVGVANATQRAVAISQSTTIESDATVVLRLRVGDLEPGDYELKARGQRPMRIDASQHLVYDADANAVFVQTDKAIYRPGNNVSFRVAVVTPQLKPGVSGSLDVRILDGDSNLIRRWERVFPTKGVFASSLRLADEPVLGDWHIVVSTGRQTYKKSFLVAEYVLPKFVVDIELPAFATFDSGPTSVVVRAEQQGFGGPVDGEVILAVYPKYKSSYLQPIFSEPVRRTVAMKGGVANVDIDLARELNLSDDFAREIVFSVRVKEGLTGRIQNNTASMWLYKYAYKMELVKTAEAFKPRMPYNVYLKVGSQDDMAIHDDLNQVSVRWGFGSNTSHYNVTEFALPEDGILRLRFDPPDNEQKEVLGIEATYKDLTQWFSTVPASLSSSHSFLHASLITAKPIVGRNVRVALRLQSQRRVDKVAYVIMGRGRLVRADTLDIDDDNNNNVIEFRATSEMAPTCQLLVYYVRAQDGEVVADALEFEVQGALTNFVDIYATRRTPYPGTEVTVNLRSEPNSLVALLAVEQSVRSLKSGHDIELSDVMKALRNYDASEDPNFFPWFRVLDEEEALSWHLGSEDSSSVFRQSGTTILTNGHLQMVMDKEDPMEDERAENRPVGRPLPDPDASTLTPDIGPGVAYESATRPPLAGPYAFSRLPRPVDNLPKVYLKHDLPSTWLFINATTDASGLASVPVKAPMEANTTWILSAFALDSLHGLGLSLDKGETLTVFQPFFVRVDVPRVVKRGETLAVQMVVFNYLEKEIEAEVTLENPGGSSFHFGPHPNEVDEEKESVRSVELFRTKRVSVLPGRGTLVSFLITPRQIGLTRMKVSASASVGSDVQIVDLLVEAEGQAQYNNTGYLIDLRNFDPDGHELNVSLVVPENAIDGSTEVFIAASADPLGIVFNNLDDLLINRPSFSGAQNLIRVGPAAIVADYLSTVGNDPVAILEKAKSVMEEGYQRQLAYKLEDGSFSAFGHHRESLEKENRGSVWVTALVINYFPKASDFIDVDEQVVQKAIMWLIQQQENGVFKESGAITYRRLQADPLTLTSFVAMAMMESKIDTSIVRNAINSAINHIADNWRDRLDDDQNDVDVYALAMATRALQMARHPDAPQALTLLEAFAKRDETKRHTYWSTGDLEGVESANPWTRLPNSANIEATSYALLSLLDDEQDTKRVQSSVKVAAWLLSQQNEKGGFASTTDTLVAIQALRSFSQVLSVARRNSEITVHYRYLDTVRQMRVSTADLTVVQRRLLPHNARDIRVRAEGGGLVLIQVGVRYNVAVTLPWPSFVVNPQVFRPSTANHFQLTVCSHYIQGGRDRETNLGVMEVRLPSGFTANMDALPALRRLNNVRRVDSNEAKSAIIVYFETLSRREVCPTFSAFRTHRVANQKPASVIVYDYYDQSRRARAFYDVVPASICDICNPDEDDECPNVPCPDKPAFPTFGSYAFGENVDEQQEGNSANHFHAFTLLILVVSALHAWPTTSQFL